MAFDQHIEADQVGSDNIGLFSSIIARPILWLLGVDQDKAAEEKGREDILKLECDMQDTSDLSDDDAGDDGGNSVGVEGSEDGTKPSFTGSAHRDSGFEHYTIDRGRRENDLRIDESCNRDKPNQIHPIRKSSPQSGDDCSHASLKIVDGLVVAMGRNTIEKNYSAPATRAASFRGELSSSHSASEFSTSVSPKPPLHKANSSNSMKSKKTSWSDEHGDRPLVEYSDDHHQTIESRHWTQLRRKKRSISLDDGNEKRSQVRVIKSALRAGSYSPPVSMSYASDGESHSSHSISSSSSQIRAEHGGKISSNSLSIVMSSLGTSSPDSISVSENSDDSLAAELSEKLSMKDNNVQCVPSTLKQRGQRANGLIIPSYHLTMGTQCNANTGARTGEQLSSEEDYSDGGSNPTSNNNKSRMQTKAQNTFLPHPPNGHVSPQYGFYVNITPPTTLHTKSVKRGSPLRPFEESSPQQQSFKGFSPFFPSPIPEVELAKEMGAAPHLATLSGSPETSADVKNRMKPTFPKNRVGMGMVLAGNQHHAWPSIPMG